MKIEIKIEVFDDPEFCNDDKNSCSFVSGQTAVFFQGCNCFEEKIYYDTGHIDSGNYLLKCDQCKAAYRKAKNIPPPPKPVERPSIVKG